MTHPQELPKTIGELIGKVERIREDLLHVQRQLEKMEIVETALSGDGPKEAEACNRSTIFNNLLSRLSS